MSQCDGIVRIKILKKVITWQAHPQVVGVKYIELLDRFKILLVIFGHLGHLKQSQFAMVLDESSSLYVGSGAKGRKKLMLPCSDHLKKLSNPSRYIRYIKQC